MNTLIIIYKYKKIRNEICGSNGIIYANRCEFDRDKCLKQENIYESSFSNCLGIGSKYIFKYQIPIYFYLPKICKDKDKLLLKINFLLKW